jgi:type III restriction enzyme
MSQDFFNRPILNSPYEPPTQHWRLSERGQPLDVEPTRRRADFFMPIPKSRKKKAKEQQTTMEFRDEAGLSTERQQYEVAETIMAVRNLVEKWRLQPDPSKWQVTPTTQRLLQHWRRKDWDGRRPFFCQVEAVETTIWLTEVAPRTETGRRLIEQLESSSREANPLLNRLGLKLATGAGKTTVMAMLMAWQTLNAVRSPQSKRFTRGFLVVAPGITIRDRLRVILPNDPNNYYEAHQLVPSDMQQDMQQAKIVVTNYHAFKLRERISLAKGTRELLQGRGPDLDTQESPGQMIQRVMPELMGMRNVLVINDEAHHCYREKPKDEVEDGFTVDDLKGDEKKEAKKENEAARLWISGLEMVQEKIGVSRVVDLSATPFFLKGSGYQEGTIFPWVVSDFSLMDAIECGIVKLPRVPVADNIPGEEVPVFRKLWEHIRKDMPKKGRGKNKELDPLSLPTKLQTALEALYGHYEETYELWQREGISVPPCFIIVCNNTATSKLVYDYVSGFRRENGEFVDAKFELFSNYDQYGNPYPQPNTLLIDSEQLESGEALDKKFREAASEEIERFRREIVQRSGNPQDAENISEADLLREVMNTVGKKGKLGESIRCVVSVSMLTEGWDANTVTHILGVRAFGTQLLCEQVIGRALRRQSYELNEEGLFNVEYADILGIPFDFASEPVLSKPTIPRERVHVHAVRPERDHLEIRFPRVQGYRIEELPPKIEAEFTEDDVLRLTPKKVGATEVKQAGIIGETADLNLKHLKDTRPSKLLMELTARLLFTKFRDENQQPKNSLYGGLRTVVRKWLKNHLVCDGGTYPAQLLYQELADMACERINNAINRAYVQQNRQHVRALLDSYNPAGSSHFVNFYTTKEDRWETDPQKSPVNWAVLDSDWEGEFCRVVENHPRVLRYLKNQGLGFEVPYKHGGEARRYIPDFIVCLDDGHGSDDPLHLVVEIKGYRGEDAKVKASTMQTYWVPGVNALQAYGRWAFVEFRDVFAMQEDFADKVRAQWAEVVENVTEQPSSTPG